MGAEWFETVAEGRTAKEAFTEAVEHAQYMSGHGGYTGTIAEKTNFIMVDLPEGWTERGFDLAEFCSDLDVDDKWGPAGCVKVPDKENTWLFFGWASS